MIFFFTFDHCIACTTWKHILNQQVNKTRNHSFNVIYLHICKIQSRAGVTWIKWTQASWWCVFAWSCTDFHQYIFHHLLYIQPSLRCSAVSCFYRVYKYKYIVFRTLLHKGQECSTSLQATPWWSIRIKSKYFIMCRSMCTL